MVGRLGVDFGNLLGQCFVLLQRDAQSGPQRRPLRTKQRVALSHALDYAFESVPLLAARATSQRCVAALPGEIRTPRKEADWRRVRRAVDLDQLIEGIG